ncbi:hypothetical protein QQ008_22280 [Fulvivirgaceae bacterium BMA10]|uniref:Schlafen AlbA-2 domain-containing protein n=1 Tax=Splendidivirga corallicola TaxID=3051826 RepID=A0ABT8KW10_9BACT|nr:hypothetical protein [Fulvivirgaceae bacterium BMA10]
MSDQTKGYALHNAWESFTDDSSKLIGGFRLRPLLVGEIFECVPIKQKKHPGIISRCFYNRRNDAKGVFILGINDG